MAGVKGTHMKWDGGTVIPFFREQFLEPEGRSLGEDHFAWSYDCWWRDASSLSYSIESGPEK